MKSPPATIAEQQRVLNAIEALEAEKAQLHARGLALRAEVVQLWSGERSGFAEMELAGTALIGQIRASRALGAGLRAAREGAGPAGQPGRPGPHPGRGEGRGVRAAAEPGAGADPGRPRRTAHRARGARSGSRGGARAARPGNPRPPTPGPG